MFPRDESGGAERTAARLPGLAGPSRILGRQGISNGNDKKKWIGKESAQRQSTTIRFVYNLKIVSLIKGVLSEV